MYFLLKFLLWTSIFEFQRGARKFWKNAPLGKALMYIISKIYPIWMTYKPVMARALLHVMLFIYIISLIFQLNLIRGHEGCSLTQLFVKWGHDARDVTQWHVWRHTVTRMTPRSYTYDATQWRAWRHAATRVTQRGNARDTLPRCFAAMRVRTLSDKSRFSDVVETQVCH